jgi:hypothetical protein
MNVKKIIRKVEYWLKYEARYYHKHFITGIKNLWKWFLTIWKDRDWDDYYIWILLEKKLINQAKYIGKRGIHLNANRDAERMMTCVRLIQKVREEWYRMEYMDYHKSEYHWDDIKGDPDHKQLRIEELSENFDDYFKKYPLQFKKIFNSQKTFDKNRIAIQISWENHKRAKALLFKILNRHIEEWWD